MCQLEIKVLNIIDARCNHEVYWYSVLWNLTEVYFLLNQYRHIEMLRHLIELRQLRNK